MPRKFQWLRRKLFGDGRHRESASLHEPVHSHLQSRQPTRSSARHIPSYRQVDTDTWERLDGMVINISASAYRKMMTAIGHTHLEVSGYGTVIVYAQDQPITMRALKRKPDEQALNLEFYIDDVWLLDKGTFSETNISPRVAAEFMQDRIQDGIPLQDIKLWWHRHPVNGWSGTDETAIRSTPLGNTIDPKGVGWMIAIVWTPKGWIGRFDQLADPGYTLHIPVLVDGQEQVLEYETINTFKRVEVPSNQLTLWEGVQEVQDEGEAFAQCFKNACEGYRLTYQTVKDMAYDVVFHVNRYGAGYYELEDLAVRMAEKHDIDYDVLIQIVEDAWNSYEDPWGATWR